MFDRYVLSYEKSIYRPRPIIQFSELTQNKIFYQL
jgi:hypothetical protein